MKSIMLVVSALIGLVLCSCQLFQSSNIQNSAITALISNETAVFKVPIKNNPEYVWNEKNFPDDMLEYECEITVNSYKFGFSLFKFPGAEEHKGTIEQLFKAGQMSVWKIEEGNTGSVTKGIVRVSYKKPHIVISVLDPETYKMIFSEQPRKYKVGVTGFKPESKDVTGSIDYK